MPRTRGEDNSAKCRIRSLISHGGKEEEEEEEEGGNNCSTAAATCKYLWDSFSTQHAYGLNGGRTDGRSANFFTRMAPALCPSSCNVHRAKVRQFQSWHIPKKIKRRENERHFSTSEWTTGPFSHCIPLIHPTCKRPSRLYGQFSGGPN